MAPRAARKGLFVKIEIPFGDKKLSVEVPAGVDVLRMQEPEKLVNVKEVIADALRHPIGTESLMEVAKNKRADSVKKGEEPRACIVVSDNTRPVPYAGDNGLMRPIISTLSEAGYCHNQIHIVIACGTHRAMDDFEIEKMLGKDIARSGIHIINHNCRDEENLIEIGRTKRGTTAKISRYYVEAGLKILTGLVESHFMAGVSGGRKAICPGIFGEEGTYIFHGPELMAHPNARDLVLTGNPVHEESLAVAQMIGADFIANVTLNSDFDTVGVFCGDLVNAHKSAVEHLKGYVSIPIDAPYDLVITHSGFVGISHYQSAKAAVASINAVKPDGTIIQLANNCDKNPVGSDRYRLVLLILKTVGPAGLEKLLFSKDWTFIPEQWQVQLWARMFKHIDMSRYIYYAPQLDDKDWRDIPGVDGRKYLENTLAASPEDKVKTVIENAVRDFLKERGFSEEDLIDGKCRIAFLSDGPYGIPMLRQ